MTPPPFFVLFEADNNGMPLSASPGEALGCLPPLGASWDNRCAYILMSPGMGSWQGWAAIRFSSVHAHLSVVYKQWIWKGCVLPFCQISYGQAHWLL